MRTTEQQTGDQISKQLDALFPDKQQLLKLAVENLMQQLTRVASTELPASSLDYIERMITSAACKIEDELLAKETGNEW